MSYTLPPLPYAYDALEPYLDKETMEIHHGKHHQTYVNNTNALLEDLPKELTCLPIEQFIANLGNVPETKRKALRNQAGGHANHTLFWSLLKKETELKGQIKELIIRDFGSVDNFKEKFSQAAAGTFGSGWAWLIYKDGKLAIISTSNQDSPVMGENIVGVSGFPLLLIDVWEHSYYLKFQNRRADYIKQFWDVINWDEVERRLLTAINA